MPLPTNLATSFPSGVKITVYPREDGHAMVRVGDPAVSVIRYAVLPGDRLRAIVRTIAGAGVESGVFDPLERGVRRASFVLRQPEIDAFVRALDQETRVRDALGVQGGVESIPSAEPQPYLLHVDAPPTSPETARLMLALEGDEFRTITRRVFMLLRERLASHLTPHVPEGSTVHAEPGESLTIGLVLDAEGVWDLLDTLDRGEAEWLRESEPGSWSPVSEVGGARGARRTISVVFDPERSDPADIADVLARLSWLYRAVGGDGLQIVDSGIEQEAVPAGYDR